MRSARSAVWSTPRRVSTRLRKFFAGRAVGKKDISRIFNAEAGLLGIASGLLGVGIGQLVATNLNLSGFSAILNAVEALRSIQERI
ncbi:hypothetical protein [Alloscardovia macacae]|uniref:Macrolide ABC transporter ATP-binding protein n=1 Tax=Alloscardovia macacae TaxID=1160091 RepID=A0A261F1X3_9BIFI|nr:hypothetical protein [Alloscardovia macacae]OZG53122.1 macrolide ABC transporter ATP-binding protein [Alloscardovia macacae]